MQYSRKALNISKLLRVGLVATGLIAWLQPAMAQLKTVTFDLTPQPKFVSCLGLAERPTPTATVTWPDARGDRCVSRVLVGPSRESTGSVHYAEDAVGADKVPWVNRRAAIPRVAN